MIRKIYLDILRRRLADLNLGWLFRAAVRYPMILFSALSGRPFCGPVLGTLVTNYSCNCRCAMCELPSQDGSLRAKGLTNVGTEGLRAVLDQFRVMGVMGVGFTGGEPLLHKDIMGLLDHCRRLEMLTHLNTNGLLLDDRVAADLVRIGVDSVNVSLDGARADTHDAIRGVPGAFDAATGAIRRILTTRGTGPRPRVKAVMVVQETNAGQIEDLARLAADLGADCVEFIAEQPFGRAGGVVANENLAVLSETGLESLLRSSPLPLENSPRMARLIPWTMRGRPSPIRCLAGFNSITVDCYGRVYPCLPWLNWDRNPSNLAGNDLTTLWKSRGYATKRQEAADCRDCTLNCQAELNLLFAPFQAIS